MMRFRGYLMVALAATCWGLSATAAKMMLREQVSTLLIVQTRATFSAIILAGILLLMRPSLLRIGWKEALRCALLGVVGIAGANFTYYDAIHETSVAVAIVLQYTAPLLVMAYAAISGEEALTPIKIGAAALAIVGCLFAVGGWQSAAESLTARGLISAAGSSVCFGFMAVYARHLLARNSAWTVIAYALLAASIFWLAVHPPAAILAEHPGTGVWGVLVVFAVVSVLVPYALFFGGLRHIVSSRAIIVSTLEPIVAIVSAALIAGETLTWLQRTGAAVVVASVGLVQLQREPGGDELREVHDGRQ
jgi:drug/metabolite transporter (DMT)-like permease